MYARECIPCGFAHLKFPVPVRLIAAPGLGTLIALLLVGPTAGIAAAASPTSSTKPLQLVQQADGQVEGQGGRYALVIGVNSYARTGLVDLNYSESDAQAVRDVLVRYGGFPESNVRLMLGEQATADAIMLYLDNLRDAHVFPDADTFVLYFSGHGGVIASSATVNADAARDNFLIPADGTNMAARAMAKNVPMNQVQEMLDHSVFKRRVVLLDACRNLLQVDSKGGSAGGLDLSRYSFSQGTKVMAGAAYGELSYEDEQLHHSVFTYYLLQGLLGGAKDDQGVVTLAGLEGYVPAGMAQYARDHPGRKQTPAVYGEGLGPIPLTIAPGDEAAKAVLAPPPASWVLNVLKLRAAGQAEETVKLAEQLVDEHGVTKQRSRLPAETWQAAAQELAVLQLKAPTALGAFLASSVQQALAEQAPDMDQRLAAALALAQDSVRLAPDWARSHGQLGRVYHNQKRYDEAIAEYQSAIRLDPQWAYPHNNLGYVYDDQKRYDEALAEYQTAIRLDPQWAYPHNNLGNVYDDQQRYAEAIAEYQTAIRLDPQWAYPHYNLGNVYYEQQRYDEAIAEYQTAVRLDPAWQLPKDNLKMAQAARAKAGKSW